MEDGKKETFIDFVNTPRKTNYTTKVHLDKTKISHKLV